MKIKSKFQFRLDKPTRKHIDSIHKIMQDKNLPKPSLTSIIKLGIILYHKELRRNIK